MSEKKFCLEPFYLLRHPYFTFLSRKLFSYHFFVHNHENKVWLCIFLTDTKTSFDNKRFWCENGRLRKGFNWGRVLAQGCDLFCSVLFDFNVISFIIFWCKNVKINERRQKYIYLGDKLENLFCIIETIFISHFRYLLELICVSLYHYY